MTGLRHAIALVIGLLALFFGGAAQAQENLAAGKTPAELFQLDCVLCHKGPEGLARHTSDLEGFLALHYTASRETAAAIADYLKSVDRAARPALRVRHPQRKVVEPRPRPGNKTAKESDKPGGKKKAKSGRTAKKKVGEAKSDRPAKKKAHKGKFARAKTSAAAAETPAETKSTQKKSAERKVTKRKGAKKRHAPRASQAKREKPKSAAGQKKTD